MSGSVLTLITVAGGAPDRGSLEALTLGRQIATESGRSLQAIIVAETTAARAAVAELAGSGVANAIVIEHGELTVDHSDAWASVIAELADGVIDVVAGRVTAVGQPDFGPIDVIVGPGTERSNDLMARVAARLGQPFAANCLSVEPGDQFRILRQRWAGSLIEDCILDAHQKLLTVAPNTVSIAPPIGSSEPRHETIVPEIGKSDLVVHVISREPAERGGISLADAKVVVGGGRGVGSGPGFADLEELAGLLGGAVGGSRVVTSAGWRPHADQIGQTGLRIAPDIYIACGISGAIQHIVGCKAAKLILAINTDEEAPIMSVADYAVIGDLHAVVPAISAEIRRRSGAGA
jgi:electron transfer flavoprotein alpha subunit